jgi:hypothetical protein
MLRLSRLLFLLPVLVLVWVRWRTGAMPNRRLLFWVLMAMLLMGAGLAWYGNERAVHGGYVPARLQNGQVLPAHGGAP